MVAGTVGSDPGVGTLISTVARSPCGREPLTRRGS